MIERPRKENQEKFEKDISKKESRKIRARKEGERPVIFGFGMLGLIGWAVAIPTLLGIALGIWMDSHYPAKFSWTLTLLFTGLILGCVNAWFWVKKVSRGE